VSGQPASADQGAELLALYDRALPQVYGYLLPRCGSETVAEDLTGETFLAAVAAVQKETVERMTVAWLVGVARHKLVDHWRRQAREDRNMQVAADAVVTEHDPWGEQLDTSRAHQTLAGLRGHHRAALTLRYVDDLSVPEVAEHLGRTVHATEALLVRSRSAFRRAYGERRDDDG
jgi:RNA polymerase sigma-70 factor (ECF subfamily)